MLLGRSGRLKTRRGYPANDGMVVRAGAGVPTSPAVRLHPYTIRRMQVTVRDAPNPFRLIGRLGAPSIGLSALASDGGRLPDVG